MNEIQAQEYINKNSDKNQERIISDGSLRLLEGDKLTGDLIIQDYSNLEEIDLKNHELTSLTITNCPNLKSVNLRNNQLTKLEIEGENQISEIIAGKNELTTLNLTNCSKIKELIIPDNPYLNEIKGLNLTTIKNINITNTSVNLAQDYEELKAEKERLLGTIETLKEGAEEGKLMFSDIENSVQMEEVIQRFLAKTEKNWREYLTYPEKALPAFQIPESRQKIKKVLIWIVEAQTSRNYWELATLWNEGEKYNGENDFDCNSLDTLMRHLKNLNNLKKKEETAAPLYLKSSPEVYEQQVKI